MADEEKDITGDTETPTEPSSEETVEEEVKEPQVPLSRLREETTKRKDAEKLLQEAQGKGITPEEEKVRTVLEKISKEKKDKEIQEDKQLKEDLNGLHEIYGDFDDDKLQKIAKHYGTSNWDRAMELYQKFGGVLPPKANKKLPSSERTSDVPLKESFDPTKTDMWQIVEEAKKQIKE